MLLLFAFSPEAAIVTDRPDFTESSIVVPRGSVQLESGFTRVATGEQRETSGPEILLRFGAGDRLEWRLGLPNYSRPDRGPEGFGDLYIGAKWQAGPLADGVGLAFIPALSVPTGRRGVRSEAAAPELKACWSKELSSGSLSGMVYVASVKEGGDRKTLLQHTLSLGRAVGPKTGAFVEHVLDLAQGDWPQHTLHSGWTYQPSNTRQLDLHYGLGLSRGNGGFFVGLGYSERFE